MLPAIVELTRRERENRITVRTPCDPETEPEAIEGRHRFDVELLVKAGCADPVKLSEALCLPLWNVKRALHWLKTGRRLPYPKVKTVNENRTRHQNPGHFNKFKPLSPKKKAQS